jgi:signal transduction histidine kinase
MQRGSGSGQPVKGQCRSRPKARKAPTAHVTGDRPPKHITRSKRERDEALEQLAATSEILRVIRTSPTDVQPVFETIVRSAVSLCGSLFANVFRFDGELLHWVVAHNVGPSIVDMLKTKFPMRPDRSAVAGRVLLTKSVIRLEDALTDPDYDHRFPGRRLLGVPMLREGDPVGVIVVGWAEAGPVPKAQEQLLKTFADQAAIAIENTRLLRELNREREALARQHQADARYISWLRQLAGFLRHEVRQPVAQINSSVELIHLTSHDDQLRPYIASASQGVRHVWNLIERASRATDAEAFVRQGQAQPIDLPPLLRELIGSYQQTHSGIDFRLQPPDKEPLYVSADPTLLKEAVSNLLANAASFADEESIIQVVLERDGVHAVIKVRNKGPIIQYDTEMLFGPFASTRSGPSSEHQGLGLYLVRLVAEHHGGKAIISNLDDGSGVEASIFLPL